MTQFKPIELNLEQSILLINKEIESINFPGFPTELYEPINYILKLGGKRLRPVLVYLGCGLFDGNLVLSLPAAKAIEVFHNFTLVHDDIMDNAPLRRGKSTVHEKWNQNIGILSGDAMLIKAYDFILDANYSNNNNILKTFNKAAIEVCEGQQLDMNFESISDVSVDDYINMIRLKTSVLLGAALKIGAQIANSNEKDSELIYDFGVNLGIMFQLMDDYLDAFGDPEKFGKKVGGDIISNKKTFLFIQAINEDKTGEMKSWMKVSEFNEFEKIKAVKNIYLKTGVDQQCLKEMDLYFKKAMDSLDKIQVPNSKKENLIEFANYLRFRSL